MPDLPAVAVFIGVCSPRRGQALGAGRAPSSPGQRHLHRSSVLVLGYGATSVGASRTPSCQAGCSVAACGQWKITGWGDGGGQAKPRLAPPRHRLRHCCMPWACLCRGFFVFFFFLAFPGIEELALGIFVAVPRSAHLCSRSSPSAHLCRATVVRCPHPKCGATTLLPPLFAPQGLTPQARHLQMPWGSILLPAQAGWALSCPSPAPHSLSTLYLI